MHYFEDILIVLAFSLPAYFFWRWLYSKFINNSHKRQATIWVSTILITPLLYWGAIMLLLFYMCYYPTSNFDKREWFANKDMRYRMTANIIESKMLIGKTKAEVNAILGKQENISGGDKRYYYLGFLPGFAMDADELYIQFNNDKVIKVAQIHG
ncbi:MAG: hypothetical protein V4560_01120 [Bacteroidota bacterium]